MFWFFKKNKEIKKLEEQVEKSFSYVKEDLKKVGDWIKKFDEKTNGSEEEIKEIKEKINCLEEEIKELKNSFFLFNNGLFKHKQTAVYKQTGVVDVQTPVQTAVQTSFLDRLTLSEKIIIFTLMNSEMKLSYDDLAALLGKNKSTIRGQVNSIKQKSESLIKEYVEQNGKKRLFVPEETAKLIMKKIKVRVKKENKKN